jgi:hypothetical protein
VTSAPLPQRPQGAQSAPRESAAPQLPDNQWDAPVLLRRHYPVAHCGPSTVSSTSSPQPRAVAGEGSTARRFGAPTWVGGVNQDSGEKQRRGPKHRQATGWCPAPPGDVRTSLGVQALPGACTVATCIGPPQPNASAVNGLSTTENLPCGWHSMPRFRWTWRWLGSRMGVA